MKAKSNSGILAACGFILAIFCQPIVSYSQNIRQWATYYGGAGDDRGINIVTDASGNVYLTGSTGTTSGMASGGFQNIYGGGGSDAYLVKFDPSGNRIWATYYGGTGNDRAKSVAVDTSGNVLPACYSSYLKANTTV